MEVYPDSSLGSIPAGTGAGAGGYSVSTQINNALSAWYDALAGLPSVDISTTFPGSEYSSNVVVDYASLDRDTACGETFPDHALTTSATITINSTSICTDNTQAAYQNFFYKLMLHEFGHLFGLGDYDQGSPCSSYPGLTVMAQMCNADDSGGGVPLSPTYCDYTEVVSIYYGTDDPTCGEPGGGCGGGCNGCDCEDDGCGLDPIIIDVTGSGYQLTNVANGVQFDFYGDGKPLQMAWTARGWNGGFLALDRNGNGRIDDGAELFSNLTPQPPPKNGNPNGYLALAVYDQPANGGNDNGWIDPGDSVYSKLLVWIDLNHNGISEPNELFTLKQLGIQAISLSYAPARWIDAYGNVFRFRSQMRTNTSASQWIYDVLLKSSQEVMPSTAMMKPKQP